MRRTALALFAILFAATVIAAPAPGPTVLKDLSWLVGRWVDDSGGPSNLSEEIWSAPSGDAMLGMWRYVKGWKAQIYEILTISAENGALVMRIRHFDPALVAREDKATPVVLKIVSTDPQRLVFEGPEVGGEGLVRLTYAGTSENTLVVTLEKEGKKTGFTFQRAP
jgi:Domain of unknown function (DUF6265)